MVRWSWWVVLWLSLPVAAAPTAQNYFQQGSQALAQGRTERSVDYFEQALELNPDLALAWRGLGVALGKQGKWQESAQAHRRATRLLPQNAQGWLNLGWAEHRSGNDKVAARVLNHAQELAPQDPKIPNALGIVYLFLDQPQRAETATRRVLSLDPKNGTAHYNLGLALHRLGRWSESISHLTQAQGYEPRNPHPQVALAMVHHAANQPKAALASYQRTVQMDSRYRRASYLDTLLQADFSPAQVAQVKQVHQWWLQK
ncbi:tetratricopeptide repeat protein [Candidatus Cyanaurora vandensis]|uniref:tetratricopeptide repeat protein n=1 Tax=Candidatus Cyanaurora vandensis TaxID=2714958 RepID=UPI00257EEA02|nr:tetratricopeptide repeat protein [Candidatus Cyanaurora vandensis]